MSKFPERISASWVDMFLQCPLMYKMVYIDKLPREPWNIYTSFGSAVHETIAHNYRQKIESWEDLDIKTCENKFWEFLKKELDKLPVSTDSNTYETLTMQWQEIIYKYMKEISPWIQPLLVEQEFKIPLVIAWVTIYGFIDLVTKDGIIIDHKTAGSTTYQKWTQNYVDNMLQLSMYAIAYRKMYNKAESCLRIDVLKRLKSSVWIATILTTRSDNELLSLNYLLLNMKKLVEQDLFYPNLLNCQQCPLKNKCNKICKI